VCDIIYKLISYILILIKCITLYCDKKIKNKNLMLYNIDTNINIYDINELAIVIS
jgi:hypothetical protein